MFQLTMLLKEVAFHLPNITRSDIIQGQALFKRVKQLFSFSYLDKFPFSYILTTFTFLKNTLLLGAPIPSLCFTQLDLV